MAVVKYDYYGLFRLFKSFVSHFFKFIFDWQPQVWHLKIENVNMLGQK